MDNSKTEKPKFLFYFTNIPLLTSFICFSLNKSVVFFTVLSVFSALFFIDFNLNPELFNIYEIVNFIGNLLFLIGIINKNSLYQTNSLNIMYFLFYLRAFHRFLCILFINYIEDSLRIRSSKRYDFSFEFISNVIFITVSEIVFLWMNYSYLISNSNMTFNKRKEDDSAVMLDSEKVSCYNTL